MVRTVSPKASATPTNPIPRPGNPAASTALPHPPNTSQNVPTNSANARFVKGMTPSLFMIAQNVTGKRRLSRRRQRSPQYLAAWSTTILPVATLGPGEARRRVGDDDGIDKSLQQYEMHS